MPAQAAKISPPTASRRPTRSAPRLVMFPRTPTWVLGVFFVTVPSWSRTGGYEKGPAVGSCSGLSTFWPPDQAAWAVGGVNGACYVGSEMHPADGRCRLAALREVTHGR